MSKAATNRTIEMSKTKSFKQAQTKDETVAQEGKEEVERQGDEKEVLVDNTEMLDRLNSFIFTDWKEKERKINRIIQSGNFNASKDNPPWYVILPKQTTKRFWDIFMSVIGMVNAILMNADLSWNFECFVENISMIYTIYLVISILFLIDIFLNCVTAYLDEKNLYVYDARLIFMNYLNNGLVVDILSSLPYYAIWSFDHSYCFSAALAPSKILYFFFFLRVTKISFFFEWLEKVFSKFTMTIRLIKLFTYIIFLAVFAGNLFSGLSPTVKKIIYAQCFKIAPPSSIDNYYCEMAFTRDNFFNLYAFASYMGILITLGTDFITNSIFEQIFLIVLVIVFTIVNASIYGNVAVMLGNVSSGISPILRNKIGTMSEYMTYGKFDPSFIQQIEDYHMNIWFKQRNMMYDESFFGDMSTGLHKILLLLQFKPTFFRHSKFLPIITERFFLEMVVLLKPKIYMTNDIIVTEGESTSEIFFASTQSHCKVYIGGQWVRDIKNGDYFGEIAIFLRSRRRTATVLCYKDSDFLHLEGEELQTLLRNYPADYTRIKNKAVQTFINSVKFYPSGLFAKLVPNNNLKDYLFRKSIYLEDEEEDHLLNKKSYNLIDSNDYNDKIAHIVEKLVESRNQLIKAEVYEDSSGL